MADFSIDEMQAMQEALQEKYKHKWEPICPEIGQNKLLWMIGEVGEVIDIVKNTAAQALRQIRRSAKTWLRKWRTSSCTTTMSCSATASPPMN